LSAEHLVPPQAEPLLTAQAGLWSGDYWEPPQVPRSPMIAMTDATGAMIAAATDTVMEVVATATTTITNTTTDITAVDITGRMEDGDTDFHLEATSSEALNRIDYHKSGRRKPPAFCLAQ
jgi:hypothetical protein